MTVYSSRHNYFKRTELIYLAHYILYNYSHLRVLSYFTLFNSSHKSYKTEQYEKQPDYCNLI